MSTATRKGLIAPKLVYDDICIQICEHYREAHMTDTSDRLIAICNKSGLWGNIWEYPPDCPHIAELKEFKIMFYLRGETYEES